MNEELKLEFSAFLRLFSQNIDTPFSFLLGAGASVSSGILSANDCIWEWKKSIYISENPTTSDFLDIHLDSCKDKLQRWIEQRYPEFPALGADNEYEFYAEYTYKSELDRKKFFERLSMDKQPYIGYKLLCLLHKYGVVPSIWSTNFDGLVERAAHQARITPICINLDNPQRIFQTTHDKRELLYIALHGDYKYTKLKNTQTELDTQQIEFVSVLQNYFIDKNLIVFGYSGRDQSLMESLSKAFCSQGAGRLFWCGYGDHISQPVINLIQAIRSAGREAYYISTDGFDNSMISLLSAIYKDDVTKQTEIKQILSSIPSKESLKSFSIDSLNVHRYLKTNLYPIILPKDIYQFRIKIPENQSPKDFILNRIIQKNIVVLYDNTNVYGYALAEDIHICFKDEILEGPRRLPITIGEIEKNKILLAVLTRTLVAGIAEHAKLSVSIAKGLIWNHKKSYKSYPNVFEALKISLIFKPTISYALVSFDPTLHFLNAREFSKEQKKDLLRQYHDSLRNIEFEQCLTNWERIIFNGNNIKFDYPLKSNNQFIFEISKNRGLMGINHTRINHLANQLAESKKNIYSGLCVCEPKLQFGTTLSTTFATDINPMRGLLQNYPVDTNFYQKFYHEVNTCVICPISSKDKLHSFLSGLNGYQLFRYKESDYIQNYEGFAKIYKCSLNIPSTNSDLWVNCRDTQLNSITLAQKICEQVSLLATKSPNATIIIYIPKNWEQHKTFNKDGEKFDLHSYVKAFAAQKSITTQFIEEKTINNVNMRCEIYWWLSLALFVKSMRTPWTLNNLNTETAYAGIGYSLKVDKQGKTNIVVGCSHVYNAQGQGLRYKLSQIEDVMYDRKKNPYLSYKEAYKLGMTIQQLFVESLSKLPKRVVIHKRTPFRDDEINALVDALSQAQIAQIDLVTITEEPRIKGINTQTNEIRIDNYPVTRGTAVLLSENEFLLWTHGSVESIKSSRNYFVGGKGIPTPLKITKYYGDSNVITIAQEILGFTKMNWNSFNFYTKMPATIDTSNTLAQVGNLLSHYNGITYDYRFFI